MGICFYSKAQSQPLPPLQGFCFVLFFLIYDLTLVSVTLMKLLLGRRVRPFVEMLVSATDD